MTMPQAECWITRCGLHVSPGKPHYSESFIGSTSHLGNDWDVEHGQILIRCPYPRRTPCDKRVSCFDGKAGQVPFSRLCECTPCPQPYSYEQSAEMVVDARDTLFRNRWDTFLERHPHFKGCGCLERDYADRIVFNRREYDHGFCYHCSKAVCALTGKPRDVTPVHIMADFRYWEESGMFSHDVIIRERKLTRIPLPRESAERKVQYLLRQAESYFLNTHNCPKPWRIYTMPYGARRDLTRDFADAQAGIEVIYYADLKQEEQKLRRKRRKKRMATAQRASQRSQVEAWLQCLESRLSTEAMRAEARAQLEAHCIDYDGILANRASEQISLMLPE